MKHLWFGEILEENQLQDHIANINTLAANGLEKDLPLTYLLDCLEEFSIELEKGNSKLESLLENELSGAEAREVLVEIAKFCKRDHLVTKVTRELGTDDLNDLSRVDFERNLFESWAPLGVLVHVAPGNSPGLSFLAIIEGLLAGNVNILKLSSRDSEFAIETFIELFKHDKQNIIKEKVAILRVSSRDKSTLGQMMSVASGVSAWGGEEAIAGLRELAPSTARFIPWGHKISFGMITRDQMNSSEALSAMASDCVLMEQQACSSPQTILVEVDNFDELVTFSNNFSNYVNEASKKVPFPTLSIQEQAEITNTVEVIRLESVDQEKKVIQAEDKSWRLLIENSSGLGVSPLFRTVWIKPFSRKNLVRDLLPMRGYLQTCGLASNRKDLGEIVTKLTKAGILRITSPGEMLGSYEGEPHDGVYALSRFMNRVRAELNGLEDVWRISSLCESSDEVPTGAIMGKADFQEQVPNPNKSKLFFRSGGSSGEPALSPFSYEDYHTQMQAAAEGLLAAGLEPSKDKVINLFFGGGLYGGFPSFFTILEKLEIVHFPMAAHEDLEFVGNTIVKNKINVLMGMPSYLVQLFKANASLFSKERCIKKVYFGGEHFSLQQREWLQNEFGVQVIRSASYGSVDAGPLGFQCEHTKGSVHHLNHTLHTLEVLKINEDTPAENGEVGRLVFTSKKRDAVKINRYDVGDLGRLITESCRCGRKTPTFELMGRHGDIFRAGGTFFNFNQFMKILVDNSSYDGESQLMISNKDGRDYLELRLDEEFVHDEVKPELFLEKYMDLHECVVDENCLTFTVESIKGQDFVRTSGSGKLKRVIDQR
ncbi:MAG: hypothetical protein KC493_10810 [Bacteriovoracaceae bacterium]|nr:hypothetical protein [Bacteriovoracaceae bacterium]